MNNVSENQLLLMVARRDLAGNLRPLVQRELNWDYLFATAQAHGLLPLLHKHLTSAADLIPNDLLLRLKRESVANSQNVLHLTAKQLRIYKLFKELPPQDPRFAGQPLHYVWFYNLFLALLGSLRPGSSPFTHMATANACWIGLEVWLGWQVAWAIWRERTPARAALPLLLTGLNAGALLLWPLGLLRAAVGEVRGPAELARILHLVRLDRVEVMHQLSAPFAWMVNSWDKFMLGTALGYAYLLLLVSLWAGVRWLSDARAGRDPAAPPPWRWLLVAFVSAAGMMLFHSVVGLSVIPTTLWNSIM